MDDAPCDDENIWISAGDGRLERVQALVAAGTSVNAADTHGYTPLHAAASYRCIDVCRWLLQQGADANVRDLDGDTPLILCEEPQCADLLLAAGAELTAVNDEGVCALVVASWEGRDDMVAWLQGEYARLNISLPEIPPRPEEIGDGDDNEVEEEEGEGEGEGQDVAEGAGDLMAEEL